MTARFDLVMPPPRRTGLADEARFETAQRSRFILPAPIRFSLLAPRRSHVRELRRWLRHGSLALILAVAGMPLEARAQETSRPLEFEVRPSGVEPETPEERLERRLKQREHLFRSICIHCGPGDRFSSNAPFNPYQALCKPVPMPE
jgi:hypothetical protein